MNTKLTIKNNQGEIIQTAIFHEQETLDAFLAMIAQGNTFGKPEHTIEIAPAYTVFHPAVIAVAGSEAHGIIPAEFDSQGNEISPAIPAAEAVQAVQGVEAFEEVIPAVFEVVASEYSVEIEDIIAEVALQKEKAEALKFLNDTDYKVIKATELGLRLDDAFLAARAAARAKLQ